MAKAPQPLPRVSDVDPTGPAYGFGLGHESGCGCAACEADGLSSRPKFEENGPWPMAMPANRRSTR